MAWGPFPDYVFFLGVLYGIFLSYLHLSFSTLIALGLSHLHPLPGGSHSSSPPGVGWEFEEIYVMQL